MKKHVLLLLLTIAFIFNGHAQLVTIPDPNFKNWLITNGFIGPLDAGELDTTKPSVLNTQSLFLGNTGISDLTGIQYFKGLLHLECTNNNLTVINTLPPNLRWLDCSFNQITAINYLPATIDTLICSDNQISGINPQMGYARYLDCHSNYQLTGLPTLQNITYLDCHDCRITQLWDFGYQLQTLYCQYNYLTYLWVPDATSYVECEYNYLDTLQPNLPYALTYLDCSTNGTNYQGMTHLPALPPNLQTLYAESNALVSLPALPATLTTLYCGLNALHTIPTLPAGLKYFDCSINPLGGILPALPGSLLQLACENDSITILPALPASLTSLDFDHNFVSTVASWPPALAKLFFLGNRLSVLPSFPASLTLLDCGNNLLTALPSFPAGLGTITCGHNLLTALPSLPAALTILDCSDNLLTALPVLPAGLNYSLNCRHNQLTDLPALPPNITYLFIDSNATLNCLPMLSHIYSLSFTGTGVTCLPNYGNVANSSPALNTIPLCGIFNPTGCETYWNISGMAYFDHGNNCTYNNTDPVQPNVKVMLDSAGALLQQVFTDTNGHYSFQTSPRGKYTVTVDTSTLPFSFHCPASRSYMDSLSASDSLFYNNDFALQCRNGYDLGIQSVVNYTLTRPASLFTLNIVAGDISALYGAHCGSNINGQVQLTYSGEITYRGPAAGALTPTSVVGNTITWAVADFATVNPRTAFSLIMQVDTLALASTACINISITPTLGDYNQTNNTYSYCFPIVNSFDPNEKTVYPTHIDSAGQWLTYTIRFQNTGNAPAINIHVNDTLSSSLDASSFQLIAYSAKNITQLFGNKVVFNFPNINLPDSASNPTGSIGYVQFKIKTKAPLNNGDVVSNRASVYFDYNAPVLTNTVGDTLFDAPVCSATYDTIFPTICQGSTFYVGTNAHTQSGIYSDTITNAHGCDSVVSVHLLVTQAPGAGFSAATPACVGQTDVVTYTGLFTGSPVFNWSFDGATIQSGTNDGPYSLSWSTPGVKMITLTVTSNGCSSQPDTGYVTVGSTVPTATFTATSPVCAGSTSTITYTGNADNAAVYSWNFAGGSVINGSGAGPFNVNWDSAGIQDIILSVNDNGCASGPDTVPVIVKPTPTANFTAASPVCQHDTAIVTYTGNADSTDRYTWDFLSGQVISVTGARIYEVYWPVYGQQIISLLVTKNGCISPAFVDTINVKEPPRVTLSWDSMDAYGRFSGNLYCQDNPDTVQLAGGYPPGGVYSGVGVFSDGNLYYLTRAAITGVDTIVYSLEGNGCTGYTHNIVIADFCEGISTMPTTNLFTLYPNPADDYTTLNFDAAYTGAVIMVKDITGRQLYTTQLTTSPQQIPTGNLPPGVYLVTMYSNGGVGARLLVRE